MPKVWLCPAVLEEVDDYNHCKHCILFPPQEDGDKDHVKRVIWCGNKLKRVFMRVDINEGNNKKKRAYEPVGWYCSKCDRIMTLKGYETLNAEMVRLSKIYKQRMDEINQMHQEHRDDWWSWVFEQREKAAWALVESTSFEAGDGGWFPRNEVTEEQKARVKTPARQYAP